MTPWYDGVRLTTTVRSGCPACPWAMRASLNAVSTASEPPEVRKTRASGIGASPTNRVANSSARGLVKRSKVWNTSRRRIWAATASAISGLPCPTLQYQREPSASM